MRHVLQIQKEMRDEEVVEPADRYDDRNVQGWNAHSQCCKFAQIIDALKQDLCLSKLTIDTT